CFDSGAVERSAARPGVEAGEYVPVADAVPVRVRGRVVGVLTRESAPVSRRPPSLLEAAYRESAAQFGDMIAEGTFPTAAEPG
ncbi:ATPase, partial [Xanthomonas citri pv. citri]|nr:ATPase [Xanthomonas citri pv. citri]